MSEQTTQEKHPSGVSKETFDACIDKLQDPKTSIEEATDICRSLNMSIFTITPEKPVPGEEDKIRSAVVFLNGPNVPFFLNALSAEIDALEEEGRILGKEGPTDESAALLN